MNKDDIRTRLENAKIDPSEVDEILGEKIIPQVADESSVIESQIAALELVMKATPDWQMRAKIAAQIIKLRLDL